MHRFFVIPFQSKDGIVEIKGNLAHQIRNVLRKKTGDSFILLDNAGNQYHAELIKIEENRALMEVKSKEQASGGPALHIDLYQSLLKKTKFEFVLQKGTEIGIANFIPIRSHRCLALHKQEKEQKQERWLSIIREAAEQSRRGMLPGLSEALSFEEACKKVKGFSLIFWEGEKKRSLGQAMRAFFPHQREEVNIFIGPEGGFTAEEIELATVKGIVPVSLGPRILRAETASLVAAANILYHYEDLITPHP